MRIIAVWFASHTHIKNTKAKKICKLKRDNKMNVVKNYFLNLNLVSNFKSRHGRKMFIERFNSSLSYDPWRDLITTNICSY